MRHDSGSNDKTTSTGRFHKSTRMKFLLIAGILMVLFSGFIFYRTRSQNNAHTQELLSAQTELALQFDLAIRKYVAESIRPFAQQHVGEDEFIPETMSTSFVARSVFEKVRKKFPDYIIKFSSDNPRNPANQAGPEEREIIQYFNENPDVKEWTGQIELDGKSYQARFAARRMKEKCLRCHGDPADAPASLIDRYGDTAGFHRPVGNVVALDTIAVPVDTYQAAAQKKALIDSGLLMVGLLLFLIAVYFVFRVLVTNLEKEVAQRRQVERQVRESEEKMRSIFSTVPDYIFNLDREGKITFINRALQGSAIEKVIGASIYDHIPPDSHPAYQKALAEVSTQGKIVELETATTRDGSGVTMWNLNRIGPVTKDGQIIGFTLTSTDITDRKQAEREREKLLHDTGERVKEIQGLYRVAEAVTECTSLEDLFKRTSALIPSAWQYPDITRGRVVFDEQEYVSEPFEPTHWKQTANITVGGKLRGAIEIYYLEERPELDEGPFLTEERNLIDGIASVLGAAVERKHAEEEREKATAEMERMNRLMTGREQRIIEMKKEVNALLAESGREPQYQSVLEDAENAPKGV